MLDQSFGATVVMTSPFQVAERGGGSLRKQTPAGPTVSHPRQVRGAETERETQQSPHSDKVFHSIEKR